ncbi:MAG: hypothetical protein LRS43_01980, partial [Desulfurococcales archaeon]|nr:hypothetical protein [Desulfurococcales archaeon]
VPLATESGQRVTARGKVRLDTSIVVVWGPRESHGRCEEREALERARGEARGFVERIVREGRVGYDALFAALGRALSVLTSCGEILYPGGRLSSREVAQLAYRAAAAAVAESLSGAAGVRVSTPAGRFYLVSRILFAGAGEIRMDGSTLGIMQISTGVRGEELERLSIVARPRRGHDAGYTLLYPRGTGLRELRGLLEGRGLTVDPSRALLRSSVDALHLLYYHAAAGGLRNASIAVRERNTALYDEALSLARILCKYLPSGESERVLACTLERGVAGATIDSWLQR